MPEYLSPGVYVEEKSFRPKSIEGVSTSTAGFVGPARTGPTSGEPRLLTSFADFQRIYGGLEDLDFKEKQPRTNYLAYAVRAFFEEGGRRCYVARVFDEREGADENNNKDGVATWAGGNSKLKFEARYPGSAGNMKVIIRAMPSRDASRGGSGGLPGVRPGDTVFAQPGAGTTLANDSTGIGFYDYLLTGGGDPVLKPTNQAASDDTIPAGKLEKADAIYPLRVRVLVRRISKNPTGGKELGPEEVVGEYRLNPDTNGSLIDGLDKENPSGDPAMTPVTMTVQDGSSLSTGYGYAQQFFSSTKPFTRSVELSQGLSKDVKSFTLKLSTTDVRVTETSKADTLTPESAEVSIKEEKGPAEIEVTNVGGSLGNKAGTLIKVGAQLDAFEGASLTVDELEITDTDDDPHTRSSKVKSLNSLPTEFEIGDLTDFEIELSGGNDGREPTSFVTSSEGPLPPDNPEGFDALEDLENVSIVAAPGYTEISDDSAQLNVQSQLIDHCADMQYRMAVLATPSGSSVKEARDWRGNIDSTYAAMYHPWITIYDPLTRSELNVSPEGHVAGIYARNDVENGVHKAPANEVVRSAVGFETRINKRQQDVLNPEGVNCFRFFEGRGNRLWGARMATSDSEYKYVNIRRYLAYLERSIDEGTQVFVFENNGTDLWREVRRTIGSFLKNEWRSDRLMGTTPEQAYFVKCDRSTMTQNDIDNGRLICEIGVALFRPAEFVIFRIGQKLLSDTG